MNVGKAHQRIIREEKSQTDFGGLFGYPTSTDIKKAELKAVNYETAKKIIKEYEWLGTMGTTQLHYGIFYDGVLGGVVCFGYFQAMNTSHDGHPYAYYVTKEFANKGIQLTRGACAWWVHEHSGSKLIGYGLREMQSKGYKYAIAFSDSEAGEIGTLYQATNWHYIGITERPHYDLYFADGRLYMNDRDFYKKYKFGSKQKLLEFIADKPQLRLKKRLSKGRYIKLLGTKKENKIMLEQLEDKILPYPKRTGLHDE
tara:strand:+ start:2042 stop:2809 length:768 start_codon:yes stop_codon:yes gene_type:complete